MRSIKKLLFVCITVVGLSLGVAACHKPVKAFGGPPPPPCNPAAETCPNS